MDSDVEEMFRKKSSSGRKRPVPGDVLYRQLEQFRGRPYALTGEVNFMPEEDIRLETTRARLSNVLKRHDELKERLSRDTDKMVFDRLQREFEAARAAQTEEISLEGEQWNDGLLATVRERTRFTWKLIEKQWQDRRVCHLILISKEKLRIELEIRYIVLHLYFFCIFYISGMMLSCFSVYHTISYNY
uniref:Translation initiation factor IF-2 n=1 Tax=Anthurium amnicola TaxID=1678845 RepID=A0A1D1XJY1_9ARAE